MATWSEMFTGNPEEFIQPRFPDGLDLRPGLAEKIADPDYELMPREGFVRILGHVFLGEQVPEDLIEKMTTRRVMHHYPERLAERLREHNQYAGPDLTPEPLRNIILANIANSIAMGGTQGVFEDLTNLRKSLLVDEFEARMKTYIARK